jgi:prephenate dehydrogenase
MSSGSQHIAVFGPGLMGASLLMALRAKKPETKLSVWARRDEALREVMRRGLADSASSDAAETIRGADVAVLCVPVDRMAEVAVAIAPHTGADTLVTDVGSTKEKLVSRLEKDFAANRNFVGSHPMCGSEESGLDAARADLYEGALCVVCPTSASRPELISRAEELWKSVGARVTQLSPADHDAAAAAASHVPHVAAAALVELIGRERPEFRELCATGFRDTTRIAAGSPDLWSAILAENAEKTAVALSKLEAILASYREAIIKADRQQMTKRLGSAAETRAEIFQRT